MKDYKILFGYAAVLLSIGFVIRSITFAYAYPTGPSVSMGSNPKFSIFPDTVSYTSSSQSESTEFFALTTDNDMVITGITGEVISENCTGSTNCSNTIYVNGKKTNMFNQSNWSPSLTIHNGDVLSAGINASTVHSSCTVTCQYYIQGYYAHP